MATLTYPTGVHDFAALAAAGTEVADTTTVLGIVGLGAGAPATGERWALGVVLQFSFVDNGGGVGTITLIFETSNDDGTTWSRVSAMDRTIPATDGSTFRMLLRPFTHGATDLRVSASTSGISPFTSVGVQARLTGVTSVTTTA